MSNVATSPDAAASPKMVIAVWDIGVRVFHWTMVLAVAAALATGLWEEKSLLDVHIIAGTLIAALVVFRLIWGFTGSTYARFSNFVRSPLTALRQAAHLFSKTEQTQHYVGHNPLGALMILALLVTLAALTITGVIVLGGVIKEGPLAPITAFATGRSVKELHEFAAYGLMALIVLHVLGVIMESVRTRENLARAMVTGIKQDDGSAVSAPVSRARPLLAGALMLGILAPSAFAIAHYSQLPALGVPTAALDATYVKECKSCHSAHHPSAAPAATWMAIMAGLEDHFGENASLDAALNAQLTDYLKANSAEHWDTAAANRLRTPAADQPLRITATDGWKRLHRNVSADDFKRKSVGGKLNCSQCHGDAESGRFAPRAIAIPEEKTRS